MQGYMLCKILWGEGEEMADGEKYKVMSQGKKIKRGKEKRGK